MDLSTGRASITELLSPHSTLWNTSNWISFNFRLWDRFGWMRMWCIQSHHFIAFTDPGGGSASTSCFEVSCTLPVDTVVLYPILVVTISVMTQTIAPSKSFIFGKSIKTYRKDKSWFYQNCTKQEFRCRVIFEKHRVTQSFYGMSLFANISNMNRLSTDEADFNIH